VLAFAAALAAGAACGRDVADPPLESQPIAVTVQAARVDSLRETLSLPGTVVPSALADFVVIAPESAEIAELAKAEGDAVREGDLLVRFDLPSLGGTLSARQMEVTDAASRLDAARAEANRLASYYEKGLVPRNRVDAARAAVSSAEAALGQAKATLDATKLLGERAVVRARFAGVVVKVWHAPGDLVRADSADPILRVIDPARTQVAIQVPVAQVDRVTPGLAATVLSPTGSPEGAAVSSRVAQSSAAAATTEVRLSFIVPSALPIDTAVQVDLTIEERRDVLVAPERGLVRDGASTYVWIAKKEGRAARRDVRVGLTAGGLAQILSGVAAGEEIIVTGLALLQDGTAITVSR